MQIAGQLIGKTQVTKAVIRGQPTPVASVELQGAHASIKINLYSTATGVLEELVRDDYYKLDTSRAKILPARAQFNLSKHEVELHIWDPPTFEKVAPFATPIIARPTPIAEAVQKLGVHHLHGRVLEARDVCVVGGGLSKRDVTVGDPSKEALRITVWLNHFPGLERSLQPSAQMIRLRGVDVTWKDGFGFQGSLVAGGRIDPVEAEDPLHTWWAETGKGIIFVNRSIVDDFAARAPSEVVPLSEVLDRDPRRTATKAAIYHTVQATFGAFTFADFERDRPWCAKRSANDEMVPGLRVKFRLHDASAEVTAVAFDAATTVAGSTKEEIMQKWSHCASEAARPAFVSLMNTNLGRAFYIRLKAYVNFFMGEERLEFMIVKAAPAPLPLQTALAAPPPNPVAIRVDSAPTASSQVAEVAPAGAAPVAPSALHHTSGIPAEEAAPSDVAATGGAPAIQHTSGTPVEEAAPANLGDSGGAPTKLSLTVKAEDVDGTENVIVYKVKPTTRHKKFMQAWVDRFGDDVGVEEIAEVVFTHDGKELDPEGAPLRKGWRVGKEIVIWAEPRE